MAHRPIWQNFRPKQPRTWVEVLGCHWSPGLIGVLTYARSWRVLDCEDRHTHLHTHTYTHTDIDCSTATHLWYRIYTVYSELYLDPHPEKYMTLSVRIHCVWLCTVSSKHVPGNYRGTQQEGWTRFEPSFLCHGLKLYLLVVFYQMRCYPKYLYSHFSHA